MDQRGKASGEDDPAELPSIPVQWSSAVAERDRIQPGEFVAALSASEGDREVVLDELTATAGEDRRPVGKACPLLLLLAESHLTRRLFGSMQRRIEALPVPGG